jgi:hypothetical protein
VADVDDVVVVTVAVVDVVGDCACCCDCVCDCDGGFPWTEICDVLLGPVVAVVDVEILDEVVDCEAGIVLGMLG